MPSRFGVLGLQFNTSHVTQRFKLVHNCLYGRCDVSLRVPPCSKLSGNPVCFPLMKTASSRTLFYKNVMDLKPLKTYPWIHHRRTIFTSSINCDPSASKLGKNTKLWEEEEKKSKVEEAVEAMKEKKEKLKEKTEDEIFEIIQVTRQLSDLMSAKIKNSHIDLKLLINTDEKCYVFGNRNQYIQVIYNVITNSIDALIDAKEPTIEIEFNIIEDQLHIKITDNGRGMDPLQLPKIFEPYFSTKQNTKTGIGMFMSKNIIEKQFNGTILASNGENGFIVDIKLPLKEHVKTDD